MEPGGDSRDVGRHGLGPHVVGQRVVVRRLVPGERGPTGGPAMTDLLGVCTAWGGGRCVVQPESGEPVEIPLALIVSGKPVPPRPAVRHRVTPAEAEAHVASLWAHLETVPLGAWTLRSDPAPVGRLRRRANSCLAMGDPGLPFASAEQEIRAFYAARERPVMAQVEADSNIERAFLDSGWEPLGDGDAHFQLASVARVRRTLRGSPARGSGSAVRPVEDGRATALVDDVPVARGTAVIDGDWVGLHELSVEPGHRRRGLATLLLDALLEWGAEHGASTAWLHVETDNAPGIALYEGLGFTTHHTCRYLRP